MSDTQKLLTDLAKAKAVFQLRAITAAMGITPQHEDDEYFCPVRGEHHRSGEVPLTCQTGDGVEQPQSRYSKTKTARNHTMTPTAIKPFDNYEISPCRRYEEEDRPGHYYFEPCQPQEADVWTLYGHLPEGGVESIADSETEKQAEELYQRITGQPFGSHEENAARLRQMQAAPKLLEALIAVEDAGYIEGGYQPTVDMVAEALAQATGEAAA